MPRIKSLWELVRGQNLLLIVIAVWVGGMVGASDFQSSLALLGAFSAACLGAFGNAVNDIYDRHVDLARKQYRPIPSGRLTATAAWMTALAFGAAALLSGWALGPVVTLVVGFTLFMLWLYSCTLKGWHGTGHVVVAAFSGLVFIFGALAQGQSGFEILPQGWSAAALGFLWHLAREWVKAVEDRDADRADGVRTAAVAWGEVRVCRWAAVTLAVLVVLLPVPYFKGWFSLTYLLIVGVAVIPALAAVAYYLWNVPDRDKLGQVAWVLKWTMPLGVVAIALG